MNVNIARKTLYMERFWLPEPQSVQWITLISALYTFQTINSIEEKLYENISVKCKTIIIFNENKVK